MNIFRPFKADAQKLVEQVQAAPARDLAELQSLQANLQTLHDEFGAAGKPDLRRATRGLIRMVEGSIDADAVGAPAVARQIALVDIEIERMHSETASLIAFESEAAEREVAARSKVGRLADALRDVEAKIERRSIDNAAEEAAAAAASARAIAEGDEAAMVAAAARLEAVCKATKTRADGIGDEQLADALRRRVTEQSGELEAIAADAASAKARRQAHELEIVQAEFDKHCLAFLAQVAEAASRHIELGKIWSFESIRVPVFKAHRVFGAPMYTTGPAIDGAMVKRCANAQLGKSVADAIQTVRVELPRLDAALAAAREERQTQIEPAA